MRKLVPAAICLLSLSLGVTTGRRLYKVSENADRKRVLRRVDKALSRGIVDKRCSCSSSWGEAVLTRWARTALPNTSLEQTGVRNAASSQIKNSRPTPCSLPGSKKKVTSENKVKHTKNKIMFSSILIHCLLLNIIIIYSKTDE